MATLFIDKFNGVSQWTGNDIIATTDPLGKYNRVATLASTGTVVGSFSKLIYNPSKLYQISFDYLGAPKNIESGVNLGCILSISDGGSISGITRAIAGSIKNSAPPMCSSRIVVPNDCIQQCYNDFCLSWSDDYVKFYHSGVVPLNNNGIWKHYSIGIRTNDENIRIGISDFIYSDYPAPSFAGDCYFANLLVTDLDGPTYSPTQSLTPSVSATPSNTFDKLQPTYSPTQSLTPSVSTTPSNTFNKLQPIAIPTQPIPTPAPTPNLPAQPIVAPLPASIPPQSAPQSIPIAPQPESGLVPPHSSVNNINNIGSFNTNNPSQTTVQINSNLIIGVAGGVGGLIIISVAIIGYKCYTRHDRHHTQTAANAAANDPSPQGTTDGYCAPNSTPVDKSPNTANNQGAISQSSSSVRTNYAIAFKYANPLLNDPELPHLLKLAQSAYGGQGASQLIDLGENTQQYLKFQSLRKAHGDAEAVKLILGGEDSSSSHVTYKAQTSSIASDSISNIFFLAKELIEHKGLISYIMPELSSTFRISTYEWIGLHFATTVTLAYFLPAAQIAKAGFVVASTGIFALREIIRDDISSISHDEPIDDLTSFTITCWKPTLLPSLASFASDVSTKSLSYLSPTMIATSALVNTGVGAISCYANNAGYHEPKMHQSLIEQVLPYVADGITVALGALSLWKADHPSATQYIKHGFIALNAVILTDQIARAAMSLVPDAISLEITEMTNDVLGVVDGDQDS